MPTHTRYQEGFAADPPRGLPGGLTENMSPEEIENMAKSLLTYKERAGELKRISKKVDPKVQLARKLNPPSQSSASRTQDDALSTISETSEASLTEGSFQVVELPPTQEQLDQQLVEQMELDTQTPSQEAIFNMYLQVYHQTFQGSKEATIQKLMEQANPEERKLLIQFAEVLPKELETPPS